ncbi:MAG: ASKHA domain-containing protein, partial [Desulfovibrionaceae bacterium]
MDIRVRIGPAGNIYTYQAAAGQSLAQALWLAPETVGLLTPPSLCAGLGRCGRCRVRFLTPPPPIGAAEQNILSPSALDAGWRLACAHEVRDLSPAIMVELPPPPLPLRHIMARSAEPVGLAVDLGTTSLHWCAVDTQGHKLACGQEINPQMGAGADVMSRLAYARTSEGCKNLADRVLVSLRQICAAVPAPVQHLCLAANTAMTYILLHKDCSGLASAPYRCAYAGDSTEHLPDLPPVYIPPLPSAFVGGDISAGMAFVQTAYPARYPFLLADMGTNGEFVLALSPRKAYATSVPLGPALEGMGLSCGGMAGAGAQSAIIHHFSVQATGLTPHLLPTAESAPQPDSSAICATGYLSLLHTLLRLGLVREDGSFCPQPSSPLGQKVAQGFQSVHGEQCLRLTPSGSLYLSAHDVEEISKVKAAFSLALERLLQT